MYIFKFSLNSLHNHLDWLEGFFIALFSVPEIKTENALINWHFDFFLTLNIIIPFSQPYSQETLYIHVYIY